MKTDQDESGLGWGRADTRQACQADAQRRPRL